MKYIIWNAAKNEELKTKGRPSFEEVVAAIVKGDFIDRIKNKSMNYPCQEVLVLKLNNYIHAVPIDENKHFIVLKTVFPSRKLNEKYGDQNG